MIPLADRGRLDGQLAVITGAANGAGEASARLFSREGASVILADIDDRRGAGIASELSHDGAEARYLHCDVSDDQDIEALARTVLSERGTPNILFNHAGKVLIQRLVDTSLKDWDTLMRTNVTSMFLLSKAFLPSMVARGSGVILNTSSISGFTAAPLESAYCVSKGAIMQLTRAIAVEYRQHGIRCNAICPAFIDTGHGTNEIRDLRARGENISLETIAVAQGRLCTPAEFAGVALSLACDETSFINGACIVVDNGSTLVT
jgi:NAD(P)-dependent dehydrogenase (short-subunit alcohol dehydrogenase family)